MWTNKIPTKEGAYLWKGRKNGKPDTITGVYVSKELVVYQEGTQYDDATTWGGWWLPIKLPK